jgi:hypothetical protein
MAAQGAGAAAKRPDHRRIGKYQPEHVGGSSGRDCAIRVARCFSASSATRWVAGWLEHRQIQLGGEATRTKISAVRVKSSDEFEAAFTVAGQADCSPPRVARIIGPRRQAG